MTSHTTISPPEAADRLAIRELIDAYAHCADRRDADGQKALFTLDTHFVVYMEGQGSEPTQVPDGGARRSRRSSTTWVATRRRCTSTDRARSHLIASGGAGRVTASPTTSTPRTT